MIRKFSDVLDVPAAALAQEGAFNGFVGIDSNFHIDPHLLTASAAPELVHSYERLTRYFEEVIRLMNHSKSRGDLFFRRAAGRLAFKEIQNMWLGYGQGDRSGNGVGQGLAWELAGTAYELIKEGINDPVLFELVGLLEEGIGADRISDMTARIILPDLAAFSARVAANLGLPTYTQKIRGQWFTLPYDAHKRRTILLVPLDILRPLPMASEWDDIETVVAYNQQLRDSLNQIIGKVWQGTVSKLKKYELRQLLLANPQLLQALIDKYKEKPAAPYDFLNDPDGILVWHELAELWAGKYPLDLGEKQPAGMSQIEGVVVQICRHFGRLIETHGLNALLYNDGGKLRHEIFAKLLFFGIADAYCEANDLDLTREPNIEGQPIDFKISRGYRAKVQVYVKYTSNTHLVNTYEKALASCQESSEPTAIVFLIIQTTQEKNQVDTIRTLQTEAFIHEKAFPDLILADGRLKEGGVDAALVQILAEIEEKAQTTMPAGNGNNPEDGWARFREPRRERAKLVKEAKEADPGLSYTQVTIKVGKLLGREVTTDDVKNDYRRLRELDLIDWEWGRAERIR